MLAANTKMVQLPDIAEKFTDGPFGSNLKSSHYVENGVRVLRLQDIGVDELINKDLAFISREHYDDLPRNHCKPGDVIIGTMGDPNLRACVIPDGLSDSLNKADCMMLRLNRRVADPVYISKALNSQLVAHQALTLIRGQTRGRISLGRLKSLKIPLPPLAEQKQIAGILDAADALRAKRREALAQLDSLLQATFLDLFGDPVTNPKGWEVKTLEDSGVKTKVGPFGSLLHVADYIADGVPLVNPKHMVDGQIVHGGDETVSEEKASELEDYRLKAGDLLVARRGEMGRCVIVGSEHSGWLCGTGSFYIRTSGSGLLPEFLSACVSSQPMRKFLEHLSGGAIMPSLSGTQIKNLRIPLPPIKEQERFVLNCQSISDHLARQSQHLAELDTLFASLQSRAFNGEL